MDAPSPSDLPNALLDLARQPGVLAAALFDQAAATLSWVDATGASQEANPSVRVLVEAVLTAGGALSEASHLQGAIQEIRLSTDGAGLMLRRVDARRALVLKHTNAATARLALALREAASTLPPSRPEPAWEPLDHPAAEMPVF